MLIHDLSMFIHPKTTVWVFLGLRPPIQNRSRMVCPDPVPMPRGYWRSNVTGFLECVGS